MHAFMSTLRKPLFKQLIARQTTLNDEDKENLFKEDQREGDASGSPTQYTPQAPH